MFVGKEEWSLGGTKSHDAKYSGSLITLLQESLAFVKRNTRKAWFNSSGYKKDLLNDRLNDVLNDGLNDVLNDGLNESEQKLLTIIAVSSSVTKYKNGIKVKVKAQRGRL